MRSTTLRDALIGLLRGGEAHAEVEKTLSGVKPELRHIHPAENLYSIWELLEHVRIAQEDILRYILDPSWKSPAWPGGYWPEPRGSASDREWTASVTRFLDDLESLIELVRDPNIDLTAPIPHARKHTYLREVLLAADHNAYHLGQIVQARKLLGNW